ncbi:MAG: hypothetical protein ACP5OR_04100 [Candidatus Dormibacteria bacterium]
MGCKWWTFPWLALLLAVLAGCGSSQGQPVLSWGPAHQLGSTNDSYVLSCISQSSCALWNTHENQLSLTGVPFQSIHIAYIPVSQKNGAFVQQSPEVLPLHGDGTTVRASNLEGSCASDSSVCMAYVTMTSNTTASGTSVSSDLFVRNTTSWKQLELPKPGRTDTASISGVSCTGNRVCYVAGRTRLANGANDAYVAQWNGKSWSILISLQGSVFGVFHDLGCNPGNNCIAVYDEGPTLDLPYEPVYVLSGKKVTQLPMVASGELSGTYIAAVDCTHVLPCMALLTTGSGKLHSREYRVGSISTSHVSVESAPYFASDSSVPVSFTCFTRNDCVTVMEALDVQPATHAVQQVHVSGVVWSGGKWQTTPSQALRAPLSAACSAPTICYVTSTVYAKASTSTTIQSLAN